MMVTEMTVTLSRPKPVQACCVPRRTQALGQSCATLQVSWAGDLNLTPRRGMLVLQGAAVPAASHCPHSKFEKEGKKKKQLFHCVLSEFCISSGQEMSTKERGVCVGRQELAQARGQPGRCLAWPRGAPFTCCPWPAEGNLCLCPDSSETGCSLLLRLGKGNLIDSDEFTLWPWKTQLQANRFHGPTC